MGIIKKPKHFQKAFKNVKSHSSKEIPQNKTQNNEPQTRKVLFSLWLHLRYQFQYPAVPLAVKLPHDLHFCNLAPSTPKSHLRTQPATWKLGFSFLAFLLAGVGGREGEAVAVSGGNVREFSSRVSRCKASCSARRWHSGGFAPHALLGPAALPV